MGLLGVTAEVKAFGVAGVKDGDPSAFSYFSQDYVILSECLNHHHLDVVYLVAIGAEVSRHRLLCAFVPHIRAVAVHPFIERLLCLSHVLGATPLAADEVD